MQPPHTEIRRMLDRPTQTIGSYVLLVISLFIASTFTPIQTMAQVGYPLDSAQIKIKPEIPGPLQDVQIEVLSNSVNAATAFITWRINGEVVRTARGATLYTITTGPIGTPTVLEVTVEGTNGRTVSVSKVLYPAYVGIVWEAQTYTPPLYRGKAHHSPGSEVRVTAVPILIDEDGKQLKPEDLMYTWKIDNASRPLLSGVGEQTAVMTNFRYLQPLEVSVDVSSLDERIIARGKITIPVKQPEIVLYEQHPLLGVLYTRAIPASAYRLQNEANIVAEPYHMSVAVRDDESLKYDWRVGSNKIDARGIITLRPEGSGEGSTILSLALTHVREILQSARLRTSVDFRATESAQTEFFAL